MRYLVAAVTAAALLASFQLTETVLASGPTGGWKDAGKLSTSRPSPLAALLSDGRVFVTGVSASDYRGIGNVDIYDSAHGWSTGPHLSGDPVGAVAAPLLNGGVLLAGGVPWYGGYDGPGPDPRSTAFVFDSAKGTWTAAPDMSSPRSDATATALADGRVMVVGGYDRRVIRLPNPAGQPFCCLDIQILPLATSEFFDPRTRAWAPGPTLGRGRFAQSSVALQRGQILIVGGTDQFGPGHLVDTAELFDPTQGRWLAAGSMGTPRIGFTLTALADGRALLAGGTTLDGTTLLRSTRLYDPGRNEWSAGPDMADARSNHSAASLKDGRVLVTGGADEIGRLASSEIFDPSTNSWRPAGALMNARSGQAAIALQDGRVLVIGGTGPIGQRDDSEVFDPTALGVSPQPRILAGPGRWQLKGPEPFVTFSQSVRLLKDGRLLVLPTSNYGTFEAQLYDPTTDKWTTPIKRTTEQSFTAGVALADDRVLLLTLDQEARSAGKAEIIDVTTGSTRAAGSPGNLGSARLDLMADGRVWLTGGPIGDKHTWFYDPVTDRWTAGPDVPSDIYIGTVTPVPGGRVLVGGILKAMVLDEATNSWSDAGTFPGRWQSYSATSLPSGDVLLAGGAVDQTQADNTLQQVATTRVMRWNHATGLLTNAREMPHAQPFHCTVVLGDGRVLFAGGLHGNPQSDPGSSAELYEPNKDSWSTAASLPVARAQATAVLLKDGRVLIVGGYGMMPNPPTLEYIPAPPTPIGAAPLASENLYIGVAVLVTLVAISLGGLLVTSARRRSRLL